MYNCFFYIPFLHKEPIINSVEKQSCLKAPMLYQYHEEFLQILSKVSSL